MKLWYKTRRIINLKRVLKKLVPKSVKAKILMITSKSKASSYKQLSHYKFYRNFHYLISSSYKLEQQVVTSGINKFYHTEEGVYYSLRIDIHRIEKGLVMKPVRRKFAKNYIEKCVCNFIKLYDNRVISNKEAKWCYDVLEDYFNIVDIDDSNIKSAKKKFDKADFHELNEGIREKESPFFRNKPEDLISINQLEQLAIYRRSVRIFEDRVIEIEIIENALKVASLSPTACNRQPYVFKVFDRKDELLFNQIVNLPPGAMAFKDSIPSIIAVVGKYNTFSYEGDRYNPITDASLATMSLIYGLEVQGVSSCILHWPEDKKREQKLRELIELREEEKVIMFIAIGYADQDNKVAKSTKKELNAIYTYN